VAPSRDDALRKLRYSATAANAAGSVRSARRIPESSSLRSETNLGFSYPTRVDITYDGGFSSRIRFLCPTVAGESGDSGFMKRLLKAIALTVLLLSSADTAVSEASTQIPSLREEVWEVPSALPMLAYVVRPAAEGPFPLLVMNHGASLDSKERSYFPIVEFREAALWFAKQGYVVVVPVRPGYGAAAIEIPERGLFGLFFSGVGNCSEANFRDAGLAIASLDTWVINYMSLQPFIKRDGVVVVGQSAGAWGAIALGSQNPKSVRAIISFAAGRGGHFNGKPNNNCAPDHLVDAAAEFGHTARIPMLWIYTHNDSYFGPHLSKRLAAAFNAAGGSAEYHLLPDFGADGHFLIDSADGVQSWASLVSEFLKNHIEEDPSIRRRSFRHESRNVSTIRSSRGAAVDLGHLHCPQYVNDRDNCQRAANDSVW
jgi:dienelactone hydrolase